jgi:hypothetical protein
MQHFYQNVFGWTTPSILQIYYTMVQNGKDGDIFVEIGPYYGKSTAFMAVELINSGKKIQFDTIDTFEGSSEHKIPGYNPELEKYGTYYHIFKQNMKPIENFINVYVMSSERASKFYQDNSISFIYIDASHEYEYVKNDIHTWYPKVKTGGIIAGHDYGLESVKNAVHDSLDIISLLGTPNEEDTWVYTK